MPRTAKLFFNGRSQAVRLPVDLRFEGRVVYIRQNPTNGDVILSRRPESWENFFRAENSAQRTPDALAEWVARMRTYAQAGYAFDLEENEDQIRCVAAPIRDVAGRIIAALSVSSAAQYMNDERMQTLTKDVVETARRISEDLGWTGKTNSAKSAPTDSRVAVASKTRTRKKKGGKATKSR